LGQLTTSEDIFLCEGLRRDGCVVLACDGPGEAARLLAGVRGNRVTARAFEPDGTEFRPETGSSERGVYATPRALTRFVVRSVDFLLRNRLGLEGGLAHPGARLLDPAAGPANFVLEAYRRALAQHRKASGRRGSEILFREHLLPDFQGFEILPGPWAEGQDVLRRFVERRGITEAVQRFPVFLADALASPETGCSQMGFLGEETQAAQLVRAASGISVVLGNPPFSGRSANTGSWIRDLLKGYELPDGRLDEG